MKTIILDTNFLMIPAQFRVDIFSEIERVIIGPHQLAIVSGTKKELEMLKEKGTLDERKASKVALALLGKYPITTLDIDGSVDDAIVSLSKKNTIVATQDALLKKRLFAQGTPLLILRKKKFVELHEPPTQGVF